VSSLKKLGRYDLVRVLGKGAMGIVYEARDPNLDRRVAIKTVKVENMSEEAAAEFEARFRVEARSAARLQHPNIVSVYDSDRDGDIAFLVMEFIQGDDLKHHIDKGARYTLDQSLKMIRDLLAALDYAHKQGIVHRDIKPANLLIEPGGRIKLTDFGVARIQDSGEATRTQGAMVGTLKYMSPEQVQGQPVDSRSDLFAVGIVLYQLLTDKRPFDGENDFSIIHQIIGHTPTPPSAINLQLPAAIDAVVARALAKKRDDRYATARDFAVALQAAIRGAADQTIVPPANPARMAGAADTRGSGVTMGSGTSGTSATSATSTNTSTVTQELELVYWKDIKDSADPEEIEGFLGRFPTGIYADLARRRLKKLGGSAGGDSTMSGSGGGASTSSQDTDATRMRSDVSRPAVPDGATSPGSMSGTSSRSEDATRTLVQPRIDTPAAAVIAQAEAALDPREAPTIPPVPGAGAAQNGAAGTRPAATVSPAAATQSNVPGAKPKTALYAALGVAAVAVAGVVIKLAMGGGAQSPVAAGASAPASAVMVASAPSAASATPATSSATAAATAVVPAAAASATLASASRAASAPRPAASQMAVRAKPKASAASAPVVVNVAPGPSAAAPPARAEAAATRTAPPVAASSASPKDACEGRMLIGYQLCVSEQCAKPAFQSHPVCIERREMENRRREAQQRIN
jgi:serine/threonine protein kinase